MVTLPAFKRGDTWSLTSTLTRNGTGVDITDIDIKSQIRKADRTLVVDLSVSKANQAINPGVFVLYPHVADTSTWPTGAHICDIVFTKAGQVITTETFTLPIIEEVTQ